MAVADCCLWISGTSLKPTVVHGNVYDKLPVPTRFETAAAELLPEYKKLYDGAETAMPSKGVLSKRGLRRFDPDYHLTGKPPRKGWTFYYQMQASSLHKKLNASWYWPVIGVK